jgi:hypothetical protein
MASGDLREHIIKYRTHVWPAQSGNAYAMSALRELMPVPADFPLNCDLYLAETSALLGPVVSLPIPAGDYRIHGSNNWSYSGLDMKNIRRRIELTQINHQQTRRVAEAHNILIPFSANEALDVAFVSQRLASLRLEPEAHPIAGDRRLALMVRGVHAAIAHPHHSAKHKAKRVAWLLGVGLGPHALATKFVERFYFR